MKKALILAILTLQASALSMSDLQILVNEDIVDFFSLTTLAEPVEWENITEQEILKSDNKTELMVTSMVQVTSYDSQTGESYITDYNCLTTLLNYGEFWNVEDTECSPIEEI